MTLNKSKGLNVGSFINSLSRKRKYDMHKVHETIKKDIIIKIYTVISSTESRGNKSLI
ncbi:hypothetical protein JCM19275_2155 [Nonlabens ulvanivorans]|uniref:Uncharacterized protein n=1 Tax=Nonlabens ulvanivorans TaxID=906888 RepID=A0A081DBC6_NONUL|nr:hypothetical protein [Nonlabens ulvanivorans]GAK76222.1 hypothetical protein JCM19296_1819 [Nonlabens ulvanivorans]GAK89577.1 hypothetical protein JCM19297_1405 [Nonlabens ulvanivorans]GAL76023.1 hypothetical protein JCM19275_2155 [Nonlabens ulvanivorans]